MVKVLEARMVKVVESFEEEAGFLRPGGKKEFSRRR